MSINFRWNVFLLPLICAVMVGCGGGSSDPAAGVDDPPERPLRAMNSAIRRGQWQQAWELSDAVLTKYPDDADAIMTVARVAHENQKPEIAAKLLEDACRAESFQNERHVQQAMVAMIAVGKLHEGMEMLEEAIGKQPLQHETRRWLYDFYMGTENRNAGVPHGRFLVRQRNFDVELLLSLSNTERRTQDAKPLEEMTSRNPDDLRPQLGTAKTDFDLRDYDKTIQTLQTIVRAHPDYLPAQALLGRALAASGRWDELDQWARSQTEQIEAFSGYWIALGDWARAKQQNAAAARAYWEATRRDPDVVEAWSKLSTTLQELKSAGNEYPDQVLAGIEQRASLLSRFNQLKYRFEKTGSISRALVVEIVQTLRDLGRLWEAEAWASIASTLPEDDTVAVQDVRASIVAMLRQNTPWQLTEQHAEFELDLANLDLPSIGKIAKSSSSPANSLPDEPANDANNEKLSLLNEAEQRGLTFFGYTSDDLDQPGIMLYQTLGCGGGAIDFDLDGWSDLYLVAAGGTPPQRDSMPNALFRNLAGSFSDVASYSGTADTGFGQGVAVGDVNEDGFPDLLLLNYGTNTLLVNNGDGSFTDASEKTGDTAIAWSSSAAIADMDGDGLSDLVIVNYCHGLEPVTKPCPMKDINALRSCSPMMFSGEPDVFLQARPEGTFVDRTSAWQAEPEVIGRGLGIVAGSFDDNPGMDVLIANDITNNHYWSRTSDDDPFRLSESAILRGLGGDDRALAQGSMGIATGDFDRDGDIDFYVTNFDKEYNTFHEQSVAGIWQDRTAKLHLNDETMRLVGFGSEAVDLDNDGMLELVVSNGHVDLFSRADERAIYAQPMQVFRRNGSNTYDSIGSSLPGEYLSSPHVGRALWTLDANRDGRTDFAVTHQTEPVALLVNHSADVGNWLAIQLVGRSCARDAIGAIVEVTAADQNWIAFQISGDGYLCSNERTLRFGIGEVEADCDVKVSWPDGTNQTYHDIEPNATWLLIQADEQAFRQE